MVDDALDTLLPSSLSARLKQAMRSDVENGETIAPIMLVSRRSKQESEEDHTLVILAVANQSWVWGIFFSHLEVVLTRRSNRMLFAVPSANCYQNFWSAEMQCNYSVAEDVIEEVAQEQRWLLLLFLMAIIVLGEIYAHCSFPITRRLR